MPKVAREVLEDCRFAASRMVDGMTGREWRTSWILCLTLLRAIFHVLKNVDAKKNSTLKKAFDQWQKALSESKPQPEIYWHFVVDNRDLAIKEYRLLAGQDITVRLGGTLLNRKTGEQSSLPDGSTTFGYPMKEGPFKGRDQRELLREAIDWWDGELGKIEAAAASR